MKTNIFKLILQHNSLNCKVFNAVLLAALNTMKTNLFKLIFQHIFCEDCIAVWFDRERTCPMCRASVAEDPLWRDGSTSVSIQLF